MKKLLLVLTLTLFTSQAHAFGWFLLGYAVGTSDGDSTTTVINPSNTFRYLEVYMGSCLELRKKRSADTDRKTLIKSGYITSFAEPDSYYGDKTKCTHVYTTKETYHIRAPYGEVMKKLFKGQTHAK